MSSGLNGTEVTFSFVNGTALAAGLYPKSLIARLLPFCSDYAPFFSGPNTFAAWRNREERSGPPSASVQIKTTRLAMRVDGDRMFRHHNGLLGPAWTLDQSSGLSKRSLASFDPLTQIWRVMRISCGSPGVTEMILYNLQLIESAIIEAPTLDELKSGHT